MGVDRRRVREYASDKPSLSRQPSAKEVFRMQMPKPSEEDKERFRAAVPDHPDVVVKPMFGNVERPSRALNVSDCRRCASMV